MSPGIRNQYWHTSDEAAADAGASSGGGRFVFLNEKVQQAFINRDGAALANYSLNTQNDYERLTRTM